MKNGHIIDAAKAAWIAARLPDAAETLTALALAYVVACRENHGLSWEDTVRGLRLVWNAKDDSHEN